MVKDPLEAVHSYVERAYVRMQAGDMLLYCLEEEDTAPMQNLVEELVLAGPQSLNTMREVLAEVEARKIQLENDLHQMFFDVTQKLKDLGGHLPKSYTPQSFAVLSTMSLLQLLNHWGIVEESRQVDCLRSMHTSQEILIGLLRNIKIVEEIDTNLRDWLWGLIYQSAQQEWSVKLPHTAKNPLLL